MQKLHVEWLDARSEDGWTELKDLEPRLAHVVTLGHCIKETDDVLCLAGSIDDATEQVCEIMHIPKRCILSRVEVEAVKESNA